MAEFQITSGTPAISFNNAPSGTVASTSGGASSTTVKIVKDIVLTDKEKEEMVLCGFNPNNQDDVTKYRNLTEIEKNALLTVKTPIISEALGTPETSVEPVLPVEEIVSQTVINETEEIPNQHTDIHIDTNSPEWRSMSDVEKLQFTIETGVKSRIGEERWNALTEEQRRAEKENYVRSELSEHIPGWNTMKASEKLDKMSDIVTLYSIAKNADMDFSELMRLKKDDYEKFQGIVEQYYADGHVRIDLARIGATVRDQCLADVQSHKAQFFEFCGVGEGEVVEEYGKKEYEFLLSLDPSELTPYQQGKLNVYKGLEAKFGKDVIAKLELGNKNLSSLLSKDEINALSLTSDDNGSINYYDKDNRQKICSAFAQKLLLSKKPDEIQNYLKGLSPEVLVAIMKEIGRPENEEKISDEFLQAFKEVIGTDFTTAIFNANDILTNRQNRSSRMQDFDSEHVLLGLDKLVKEQGLPSELAADVQRVMTGSYEKPYAVQAQVKAGELGVEEYVKAGNEGIAEREDATETFEDVNYAYANSDKISDDIKQFYAQSSIEVLKSPEDRQSQANSLGKYNLDSFNKGVQKGYENIANNERNNSSVNGNNVSNGNEVTKICQNPVNTSNPEAAQIQQNLRRLDLTKSEDVEKFLEIVDQHGLAISNYLAGCSAKDREDFISAYCLKANPKQIMKFLQANPSMYRDILNESGSKLAPYKEQIFVMLLPNNDLNDLAKVLDIDLEKFAKANGQYAPDIALRTKNKDLARRLVTNPVEFNFNLGDPKAPQLRLLASTGNFPEITNIGKHFEWRKA